MRPEILGWLVIGIWSMTGSLLKQAIVSSNGNVLTVVVLYNLLAAVILLGVSFYTGDYRNLRFIRSPGKYVCLVLLNGFYDVMMACALAFSAAVQYGLIANYLWPILLVVFIGVRKRVFSGLALLGALLGFIGVVVVMNPFGGWTGNVVGVIFGATGGIMWALYSSQIDKEHEGTGFFLQGMAQAVSCVAALIVALFMGSFRPSDSMNLSAILSIVGFGVVGMSIGYTLWIKVVTCHSDMQGFAATTYVLPLMSIIISTVWFGGILDWRVWVGFGFVFSGIVVSKWRIRSVQ